MLPDWNNLCEGSSGASEHGKVKWYRWFVKIYCVSPFDSVVYSSGLHFHCCSICLPTVTYCFEPPKISRDNSINTLSLRAADIAKPTPKTVIWKVLADAWDPVTNKSGFVSLGVAENRLMHEKLAEHLAKNLDVSQVALTYGDGPLGSHRIRRSISRFINRHFNPQMLVKPEHILVTNGVSHAIEHCSWAFANPGEACLLGQPYYGAFIPDISLRPGVEVLPVSFTDVDPVSVEAVSNYEKVLLNAKKRGVRVKALMLCSPHNPLGRCYSRDALIAYLKLCQKYQIHLISDEIYALSVWDNKEDSQPAQSPFISVLSFDLANLIDPSLVHVLWGTSKDFGANGIRLGCVISQSNPAFHEAMRSVAIYSYVSALTDHAVANLLEDDAFVEQYVKENQRLLSQEYSYTVQFLQKAGISYTPGANAAFFLWVDLGQAYLKRHPERKGLEDLTDEVMQALLQQKLYLANGTLFGSERPGIFRIVFSHPRKYLDEGLKRMIKAIEVGNVPHARL